MNVFLTVDCEIGTAYFQRSRSIAEEMRNQIFGVTSEGSFGLPFQIDILNQHRLKAVFFVEALCADAVGFGSLRGIVDQVQEKGQEVQLHLHTEWLPAIDKDLVGARRGQSMKDFTEDDQACLIERGIDNLQQCNVNSVSAFRAGNYGANRDTLRALKRRGLTFDTSYNLPYLTSSCDIISNHVLYQPEILEAIWELPISVFEDYPGHIRPAQLCACSSAELEYALVEAWQQGWSHFVIVWHSFELVKRPSSSGLSPERSAVVIKRFRRLCEFLDAHRDKFMTCNFGDAELVTSNVCTKPAPLRSNVMRTAHRVVEQLATRWI